MGKEMYFINLKKEKLDMIIKLQDYSLIRHNWIGEELKRLIEKRDSYTQGSEEFAFLDGKIDMIEKIQGMVVPSKKLADVCYEEGKSDYKKSINIKEDFLISEIEI
jgi:hypothetical protein